MKSLFAIGLLMILLSGLALAQEQSPAFAQRTEEWKLAFVRDGNIWIATVFTCASIPAPFVFLEARVKLYPPGFVNAKLLLAEELFLGLGESQSIFGCEASKLFQNKLLIQRCKDRFHQRRSEQA